MQESSRRYSSMRPSSPNNFARRPRKLPPSSLHSVPRKHGRCKHEAQLIQCTRATPEAQHQAQLQVGRDRPHVTVKSEYPTSAKWTGSASKQLSQSTHVSHLLDGVRGLFSSKCPRSTLVGVHASRLVGNTSAIFHIGTIPTARQ